MGLLTNYNKLTKELKCEYDTAYNEYLLKLTNINKDIERACNKYNAQIGVINSLRHELRVELSHLYKFLKKFGDVGDKITPFQYVTEDLQSATKQDARVSDGAEMEEDNNTFSRMIQTVVMIVNPATIPAVFIGDAWSNFAHSKKNYQDLVTTFEHEKTIWKNGLKQAKDNKKFFLVATEIAGIYRSLIATVKDSIADTILPELTGIEAFLTADAIKNCIISGMDPEDAEVASITEYKGTLFDGHYIFIKNAFDYYTIIAKFFTEPILTKIVEDKTISKEEKEYFNKTVEQIENKNKLLCESSMFGGEQW